MLRRIAAISAVLAALAVGTGYAQETLSDDTLTPRSTDTSISRVGDDDDSNMGWLGVLGLAGLAGLIPRERRDRNGSAHTTAR